METRVQMHDFRGGEVMQLKYFIKKLQGTARREAWDKFNGVMSFASEAAIQELWAYIAVELARASKPVVAKKPFVQKSRKPRHQRAPKQVKLAPMNPCPGQCGGKNSRFRFPDGKLARLCPSCHKAGKKEQRVPMSILRPAPEVPPLVLVMRNAFVDMPQVVLPAKAKNWRNANVYRADVRGQTVVREAMSRHQKARFAHK